MLDRLTIAPARTADFATVIEILDEAAAWLLSKNIQQWQYPAPPGLRDAIEREIGEGQVFIGRANDGRVVGAFRLHRSDEKIWGDDPAPAAYVHTLVIRPALTGNGIGAAMMAWAKEYAREQQCKYLRLDCWAKNDVLRAYYTRLGFCYRGDVTENNYTVARFEVEL